jgi:2-polyprenyl-6-hydroxyphenyl methylase / 3-demethylubiquinone-9 3-methyltransferase
MPLRAPTTASPAASVLGTEIAHFSGLAAAWWDETGPMRTLHQINPPRLDFIQRAVHAQFKQPATLKVLDLGCGAGVLSEPLARLGWQVTGVDAAPAAIAAAAEHAAGQGLSLTYQVGSVETLLTTGTQYDLVCALEIIEHVADPQAFLRQVTQLVRPGGLLILSTLNRTVKSLLLGIIAAEYLLRWVPRGTHQWQKFLAPATVTRWLRQADMDVQQLSGLIFDPLRQEFRLHPHDVAVNYILAVARPASVQ